MNSNTTLSRKATENVNQGLTYLTKTCRKSPAKKLFNLLTLFILCIAVFASVNQSSAQITAGFELEGNATAVAPNPPDDWDLIFNNTDNASVTTGILTDAPSNNDNAFTQGSSDVNDVTTWSWTNFTVPDKDDILHGGAALYNGDQLFFFADRYATNGSAEIGIWFFKDHVAPLPDGSFSGTHQVGDILLLTNFVNGGGVAVVEAYEWVGSGGSHGTLDSLAVDGINLFAITNSGNANSPWPFVPKAGPVNIFGVGAFFEGGFDLGGLDITINPCFTSFMIQTRASHSLTAELKDFITGSFFTTPQVSVSPVDICPGGSATLNAVVTGGEPPITYLWSTGATTSSITVSPASTTTYTVTVTAANSCTSAPEEVIVTVNPEPTCAIGSTNPANLICNSGNYTVGTTVTGVSYSWALSVDGNPPGWAIIGSNTTQTITFSSGNCGAPGFLVHIILTVTDLVTGCTSTCTTSISPGVPQCVVDIRPPIELNCVVTSQYLLATYSTDIFTPSFMWTLDSAPIGAGINDGVGLDSILITAGGTYRFTITDLSNPSNTCFAEVVVSQDTTPPVCNIICGSLMICPGGSNTLTASGGDSFLWSTGATTATITVSPTVTTTYTVTVTDSDNGCTSSCSMSVIVNPNPICSITPSNPSVCAGDSATLTASGGTSFLWSTGATTASITVSPASNTTYTVTVTDAFGCTSSCATTVTVNPLPVCVITCPVPAICPGGSATITAAGGISFLWSTGATTASITVSPTVTTTYTVTVTDANGCSSSCSITIIVNPLPVCSITPSNPSICIGGSSTLTASGGVSFLWSTGATTASITVSPTATTTYTVAVTDANGCSSSCSATVTVNPLPPCVIGSVNPANLLCNTGNYTIGTPLSPALFSFLWTLTVDGSPPGWAIIGSNTGQTITFSSGDCGTPGFQVHITLQVTDLATGCVSTCSVSIAPGAPACIVDIRPPVELNCIVTSQYLLATYATDFVNPIFMWWRNNVQIGPGINDGVGSDSILINQPGTYIFVVTNPFNLSDSCFAQVVVNQDTAAPQCSIICVTAAICPGGSNTLTATGGDSFLWSTGATTATITVSPLVTTTYTVTVTEADNGCTSSCSVTIIVNPLPVCSITPSNPSICVGGSSTLTASGGVSFLWSTGATTASITVSPTTTTTYTVTVTDVNGCSSSCSTTVTVNPLPICVITCPVPAICPGGSATITAAGGVSFLWSTGATTATITVSPTVTTTYTVTVTDANGCTSSCSITIIVNPLPVCSITPSNPSICVGGSSTLTASGGTSFLWSTGATTASITVGPTATTTYTVTVTDANGCSSSCSTTVTVNPLPICVITCPVPAICPGGSATITAAGGISFLWSTGATTATITVSPTVTTTYTVTVTDANGCTSSCSITIIVNPLPVCSITPSNPSICIGGSSTLTASGGTSFLWSTGATTASITVSPSTTTTYTVTVTDANGCSSSCSTTVTVNPLPLCSIAPSNPSICIGGSSTLTASGGVSFLWSTGATTASITVSPTSTTTYTVTVTDANGCSSSCSTTVTVNPLPVCSITPSNPSVCVGGSSTLTASGGVSFLWSTGATTASITASPTATTTYTVTVTDANGCSSSCSTTVTVNPLPPCVIGSVNPANLLCNTGNYTIGTPLSPALFSFLWTLTVDGSPPGWAIIGSNTTQTITFSSGNCGAPGFQVHITLQVTDLATGCVSTCSVSIAPGAPACIVDIRPPVELNCIVTSQYLLATYATDFVNPIFMWWRNNVQIGPGINDGVSLDSILITLPGTYQFVITNPFNLNDSCFAQVVVNQNINMPSCVINLPSTAPICESDSNSLGATITSVDPVTFVWSSSNPSWIITSANNVNPITYTAGTGSTTWMLIVTNTVSGCADTCTAIDSCENPFMGCTPGFWKNHPNLWNDAGDAVSTCIANAIVALGAPYSGNGTTSSLFRNIFGLTPAQMTAAGYNQNLTLLQAINLGGGGFNKLARHGVASLMNSCAFPSNFPYTTAQVLTNLHNAVISGTPEPQASQFAAANEATPSGCPPGGPATPIRGKAKNIRMDDDGANSFVFIKAYPNPFSSQTTIEFTVPDATHATLEIYSFAGSKVAVLFNGNTVADELYSVEFNGDLYPAGVYFYRLSYEGNIYYDKLTLIK